MGAWQNRDVGWVWAPGGHGHRSKRSNGRNANARQAWRRAKYEHHVGMVSVETGHRSKYDHRANIGAERNMDVRWTWAPVETERRLSMGVRWAWTPGKHGRRVGMGAGRNANIGRNAGWYRLVFGQASFLDGLLSPMGSGCWGGARTTSLELLS